ncbi:MAG: protein-disulfide reductase DsbD family protein, partial [Bacteroidota bacterium]|nr:protein-disulfide reductase DsbD family protein [Bacteroidota bacterium]
MKQITLLIGLLLFVGTQLFAQILEPVKWTFEAKQDGLEATLIFTANIEEEWHLYDTELPDGGPIRTSINFADSSLFEFVGKLAKEPLPTEYFDKIFNMKLGYFSNQAVLTQKIKLKNSDKVDIKGFVEFMSCNNETCTPPTEADFSFSLNSEGSVSSDNLAIVSNSSATPNQDEKSGNLLWFLFFSFLAGLAAILTPCVFP